ncbi:hypothetical protein cypCar_00007454 [Cyprinus carpio]|nr:hypothetical protein cypCar_00007454 [Cyprinus carpio]
MMMTIADVIKQLAHEQGKDVNLNKVKTKTSAKYGLSAQPRLVDIIAAVPPHYRRALVPKLKAKPIRTASGIAVVAVMCKPHRCPHISFTGNICVDIPMPLVSSGVEHGNLRELALARMKDMGTEGFGMMLMEEAERIARDEHGSSKLAVISGIKNILSVNGMDFVGSALALA